MGELTGNATVQVKLPNEDLSYMHQARKMRMTSTTSHLEQDGSSDHKSRAPERRTASRGFQLLRSDATKFM